jgi:hypothetical protein
LPKTAKEPPVTEPTEPIQPQPSTDPFATGHVPAQPPAGSPFGPGPEPGPMAPVAPVLPVAARRRSTSALLVNVLLGVALVVAVGGVAFAAGRATAPAPVATTGRNGNGFGGNGGFFGPNASGAPDRGGFGGAFGGANGGISIQGTVTAITADSISLQLASGQTITIPIDTQTTYHTRAAASASAVTSGSTVIVQLSGGRFGPGNGNGNGIGNGNGNGNGGQGGGGPTASGAPTRGLGTASSITVVPAGS